jgi:hypothetical protein
MTSAYAANNNPQFCVALAAGFWLYPPAFPVGVKRPYKAAILDAPGTGGSVRSARTNQNRRLSDHD